MGHIAANKDDLLKRVKRIAGQIQAVERALESDLDCAKTLHLVAATRGAINGLMEEIIEMNLQAGEVQPVIQGMTAAEAVTASASDHLLNSQEINQLYELLIQLELP